MDIMYVKISRFRIERTNFPITPSRNNSRPCDEIMIKDKDTNTSYKVGATHHRNQRELNTPRKRCSNAAAYY